MTVLLVLVGGALGALLRYLTDLFVQSHHDAVLPWGTFAANTVGSLVLGATAGGVSATDGPGWLLTLVGTGLCGALTTFSTFGYETLRLVVEGAWLLATVNVAGNVVVALSACAGGWSLAVAVAG